MMGHLLYRHGLASLALLLASLILQVLSWGVRRRRGIPFFRCVYLDYLFLFKGWMIRLQDYWLIPDVLFQLLLLLHYLDRVVFNKASIPSEGLNMPLALNEPLDQKALLCPLL